MPRIFETLHFLSDQLGKDHFVPPKEIVEQRLATWQQAIQSLKHGHFRNFVSRLSVGQLRRRKKRIQVFRRTTNFIICLPKQKKGTFEKQKLGYKMETKSIGFLHCLLLRREILISESDLCCICHGFFFQLIPIPISFLPIPAYLLRQRRRLSWAEMWPHFNGDLRPPYHVRRYYRRG